MSRSSPAAASTRASASSAPGAAPGDGRVDGAFADRFRAVFEHAGDAILLHDLHGRIVDANPQACRNLGYRREELCRLSVADVELDIVPPEQGPWRRLSCRQPLTVYGRNRRRDGSTFPVEVRLARIERSGDDLILAILRDLTDRERATHLEDRLAHAGQLAAIGRLAAGVAHEINNPAGAIQANLKWVADSLKELERATEALAQRHARDALPRRRSNEALDALRPERIRELREAICDSLTGTGQIASITRELAAFSRPDEDRAERLDLNDVARAALKMVRHEVKQHATVSVDLRDLPPLVGDRGRLTQVFVNLLVNAGQSFRHPGAAHPAIRLSTRYRDGWIHADVEDTGSGMTPEQVDRIFEPFFTTKPRGHGTGLGLALSLDIVHRHGGDIDVQTAPGEGTRMSLMLPRTGRDEAPAPTSCSASQTPKRRVRVLAIDDDPMVLRSLRRLVGRKHGVSVAHGGLEGLQVIEQDPTFDVILCDLIMPGIDGVRFHQMLSARFPTLAGRIAFVTAGAFVERAHRFASDNEVPVLSKPFDEAALEDLFSVLAR